MLSPECFKISDSEEASCAIPGKFDAQLLENKLRYLDKESPATYLIRPFLLKFWPDVGESDKERASINCPEMAVHVITK